MKYCLFIITLWGAVSAPCFAQKGVYLSEEQLLQKVFSLGKNDSGPAKQFLWLNEDLKKREKAIFGHNKKSFREIYYQLNNRRVWILNSIGKEMPITMAFAVENNKILSAHVLVYRESRGGEIRLPAYTAQFENVQLTPDDKLNKSIDGISGATLSVRASTKMARFALVLNEQLDEQMQSQKINPIQPQ